MCVCRHTVSHESGVLRTLSALAKSMNSLQHRWRGRSLEGLWQTLEYCHLLSGLTADAIAGQFTVVKGGAVMDGGD